MPKFHYVEQHSDKYWQLHCGVPTASNFHRIITGEGDASASAAGYMYELIAERLLKVCVKKDELKDNYWVQRGIKLEPDAYSAFELETKREVGKVGFVTEDDYSIYKRGCSPDFLMLDSNEGGEIKCPAPWTHVGTLLNGPDAESGTRKKYKQQVQTQLWICALDKIHFVSYHPELPLYILETGRDEVYIKKIDKVFRQFAEVLAKNLVEVRKKFDAGEPVQSIREQR
jgi:hypothetical protein